MAAQKTKAFSWGKLVAVVVGVAIAAGLIYATWSVWSLRERRVRIAQAAGLLADIKASQDAYRIDNGMYCNVNEPAPAAAPGFAPLVWKRSAESRWRLLGFQPDERPLSHVVDTIAGLPGEAGGLAAWEAAGVELPVTREEFVADHWFVARARGDHDGDGVESLLWITHQRREIEIVRGGE